MSVQKIERAGKARYRARVKWHGREVATRVFDRKRDADGWHDEQLQRLRSGEWVDPRRGRVTLDSFVEDWFTSRETLKRKTREADRSAWENHIKRKFGKAPVASISKGQIETWVGSLAASRSQATAARYLASLRSLLQYAVSDGLITRNPAADVKVSNSRKTRREGQFLTSEELDLLQARCTGEYAELVLVLGLCGLRFGELAGLRVGDRVLVPGSGLRLQRAVLASSATGELYEDTLKGSQSRTVPLPASVEPVVARWAAGKTSSDWLFSAPHGGPLSESNWKRAVGWVEAKKSIGRPTIRVHDLRHTMASIWLGAGADPKVVQRVMGHASATMTMDLYGHLIDDNLWSAAGRIGGTTGASADVEGNDKTPGAG
jgi:integrase